LKHGAGLLASQSSLIRTVLEISRLCGCAV
jgi:hypothetical protein